MTTVPNFTEVVNLNDRDYISYSSLIKYSDHCINSIKKELSVKEDVDFTAFNNLLEQFVNLLKETFSLFVQKYNMEMEKIDLDKRNFRSELENHQINVKLGLTTRPSDGEVFIDLFDILKHVNNTKLEYIKFVKNNNVNTTPLMFKVINLMSKLYSALSTKKVNLN